MVDLSDTGWLRFAKDAGSEHWVQHATPAAIAAVQDPKARDKWLQCQGTWFVGVDCLQNDMSGAVAGSGALDTAALETASALYGPLPLHPAQISVVWPGYPKPRAGESEAGFRYRLNRDAAHVDGLLAVGATRRRHVIERHAYILGITLTDTDPGASPLVVWEGSHIVMGAVFGRVLAGLPQSDWDTVDLTGIYQAARREVFDTCRRIEIATRPGEAVLLHRHCLHGVAPWKEGATAPSEGRMIAYFRPEFQKDTRDWLDAE